MFSYFKGFVRRHRKKLLIGTVAVGGALLAIRFGQRKLMEWQVKNFLEQTRREHYYRSTERNCNQTICTLADTLRNSILITVDAETILEKIRKNEGDKLALWDDLKIAVFTQLCMMIYSGLMLVLVFKIQLNLMSGYILKGKLDDNTVDEMTKLFKEKYLSLCQHFLRDGVKDLYSVIDKHVRIVLQTVSLKKKLSLQDIEKLFLSFRTSLKSDPMNPIRNLSKYLLPPQHTITFSPTDGKLIEKVMIETYELLDCDESVSISDSCINTCFSKAVDELANYYDSVSNAKIPNNNNNLNQSNLPLKDINEVHLPLAKIIPLVHGISKNIGPDGIDQWLQYYLLVDKINTFGLNIYNAACDS